ncbi:hypothetical protein [Lampropedia aestuarii]|uniref:hypothetical protein n=1 Tax=Lampropedia aestuarii TaxID=2562762 RepID=UPI002469669A|nr:hypothetical protein [Lampropedia aestuarii]MDH5855983.1 hypothetical protein [Lampropedia aestuarii]
MEIFRYIVKSAFIDSKNDEEMTIAFSPTGSRTTAHKGLCPPYPNEASIIGAQALPLPF